MITFPEHAPLSPAEKSQLAQALSGLSPEQRQWVSGFLAGQSGGAAAAPVSRGTQPLTILYGTESGNCEALAAETSKAAKKSGYKPKVVNMADAEVTDLAKAENLLVIVSTWGEGDPPETAVSFYKDLMNGSPAMKGVRFSVCALGDTSYEKFCQTGRDIDQRLETLGATRVVPRKECDVDYDEPYQEWLSEILPAFGGGESAGGAAAAPAITTAVEYGKKNPFPAEVTEKLVLNGEGSQKETWHVELDLEGSGLRYEVGDALAVKPRNSEDVVDAILAATGLTGSEEVTLKTGGPKPLREALTADLDITALSRKVATNYQLLSGSPELAELVDKAQAGLFTEYAQGRQIVDLLEDFPIAGGVKAADLVGLLRSLPPRLYSIASSLQEHPDEVHLTVAAVRYETHGRKRKGVASTALADLFGVGDAVPVFVQPNKRFRLPEDDGTPIIMVGPGTGVAPFRAFVEERAARGASGGSWLLFGDQHYTYDFLYQLEWQDHLKSGALTRLDVAFSRDQPEKVYVQHRLLENAGEVYAWLEKGAHFYVCGDAERMAGDVHEALGAIVQDHGGMNEEEAGAFLDKLKKDGRYQRDVY